jgi:hypothetical protein
MTSAITGIGTTLVPLVSIRLASTALGAVVLPSSIKVLPTSLSDDFEIQLVKNATLTGASYNPVASNANVEFDIAATAMTGGTITQLDYAASSVLGNTPVNEVGAFNWDTQLGVSISGTSDVYTLGARVITGTGDIIGSITFFDLTQ